MYSHVSNALSRCLPNGFLIRCGLPCTSAFQKLPTPVIAILSFIYPVVAILVDYIFYSQDLNNLQLMGVFLILFSAAAVNLEWKIVPTRTSIL
ncbi:EamA family transporter [Kiloniella antarctica]|uniref:EamA family transporter n=1 Tax=Kiloniella antarctica TaxID=1550907 RepID=A0ABW5BRI7_9PROT